jgi:hypothetical protein
MYNRKLGHGVLFGAVAAVWLQPTTPIYYGPSVMAKTATQTGAAEYSDIQYVIPSYNSTHKTARANGGVSSDKLLEIFRKLILCT